MQGLCKEDCFAGVKFPDDGRRRLYMQGQWYDVDPGAPWSKFFDFAANPNSTQDGNPVKSRYVSVNTSSE